MRLRNSHVTNSSSSSFIITNNSDRNLTSEDVARKLFEKIINDAKDRFILMPGESISYTCGDHGEDGAFENFIHQEFGGLFGDSYLYESEDVSVKFEKSHH